MIPDPIVAEVHESRHKISAQFGHDTERLAEHYRQLDNELRQSGEFQFVTGFLSTDPESPTTKKEITPATGAAHA